jgi:diguanylate cyclase (GGDEF)-like protein
MRTVRLPRVARGVGFFVALGLALGVAFALVGTLKPLTAVRALDVIGEGALAALASAWSVVVLASRPGGPVTRWLGSGLCAMALAAWADLLDEVFRLSPASPLALVESALMPLGVVALSVGLVLWRQEQLMLGEMLGARERGERDVRRFDRLTRLADAAYLRERLASEIARGAPCAVVMFEVDTAFSVGRRQGARAAARLLQAVVQQLLLNLRPDDLLCRYAGDRLVVLMPQTSLVEARRRAAHLRQIAEAMLVHPADGGTPLPVVLPFTCAMPDGDAQATLSALGATLSGASQAPSAV